MALILATPVLPTLITVIASLWSHLSKGELFDSLSVTLYRVAVSFIIAMAVGTALGIIMGRNRSWDATLDGVLIL